MGGSRVSVSMVFSRSADGWCELGVIGVFAADGEVVAVGPSEGRIGGNKVEGSLGRRDRLAFKFKDYRSVAERQEKEGENEDTVLLCFV